MEICNLNLDDYILGGLKHVYGIEKFYDSESIKEPLGCLSFLGIIQQITSGLAFIHSKGELHRDLKPRNGSPPPSASMLISVLLNARAATWKITDFGLTSEGASGRAYTTQYSRGTNCYRPPELINETDKRVVSMKNDIWALGCIVYELIADKKAFPSEINVFLFASGQQNLDIPVIPGYVDKRFRSIVEILRRNTLAKDWRTRPSARDVFNCLHISRNEAFIRLYDGGPHPYDSAIFEKGDERWPRVQWKPLWYTS